MLRNGKEKERRRALRSLRAGVCCLDDVLKSVNRRIQYYERVRFGIDAPHLAALESNAAVMSQLSRNMKHAALLIGGVNDGR